MRIVIGHDHGISREKMLNYAVDSTGLASGGADMKSCCLAGVGFVRNQESQLETRMGRGINWP